MPLSKEQLNAGGELLSEICRITQEVGYPITFNHSNDKWIVTVTTKEVNITARSPVLQNAMRAITKAL